MVSCNGLNVSKCHQTRKTGDLLHVTEDVLAAVKDAFALLRVQVEDEVGGVVGIGVFIPISKKRSGCHAEAPWIHFKVKDLVLTPTFTFEV